MGRFRDIISNIEKLDIDKLMFQLYQDKNLQEFILDLNRKDQLFDKSIDSEGKKLFPTYSPFTEVLLESERRNLFRYKGSTRKKKAGDSPFLFDEGEFYETFRLIIERTLIRLTANPNKDDTNLFKKYGKEIVGLTKDSIEKLIRRILEPLRILLRDEIFA